MKFRRILTDGKEFGRCGIADNYFLRLRGLIGRDVNALGGLWIKPCSQIHMFFMSGSIDAVYLDKNNKIVKVDTHVPTGIMCPFVKGARSVLELPEGSAEQLRPGMSLSFEPFV